MVKLVILTGTPGALKLAEQFLRNRNWDVFSTANIRDAISAVIDRKPEFVIIAADHPNKKVKSLPRLLVQAVSTEIIGFIENTSGASMGALNEMQLEYTIFPPVSGPAIERTVLKIRKDREASRPVVTTSGSSSTGSAIGSDKTYIKTGPSSSNEGVMSSLMEEQRKREIEQKIDLFFARGNSSGDSEQSSEQHSESISAKKSNIAYMPSHNGDRNSSQGPAYNPATNPQGGNSQSTEQSAAPSHENTLPENFVEQSPPGTIIDESARKPFEYNEEAPKVRAKPVLQDPSDPKDSEKKSPDPFKADWDLKKDPTRAQGFKGKSDDPNNADDPYYRKKQKPVPILETADISKHAHSEPPFYKQDPTQFRDSESIIFKGTQKALDESSIRAKSDSYETLEKTSQATCILINSPRFTGYLVAVTGKDRLIDQDFMDTVKIRLFDFLRSHGEAIEEQQTLSLKLEEVNFEDWAIQHADFLRKSIHGAQEVAMAFFPNKETATRLEQSVVDNMLKMSLDEIKDDIPVEFDVYFYMPSNNRFLLYTPQGRPIYASQTARLRDNGVTHIHLRKESENQVKKYRAQIFLNEKILDFKIRIRKAS